MVFHFSLLGWEEKQISFTTQTLLCGCDPWLKYKISVESYYNSGLAAKGTFQASMLSNQKLILTDVWKNNNNQKIQTISSNHKFEWMQMPILIS